MTWLSNFQGAAENIAGRNGRIDGGREFQQFFNMLNRTGQLTGANERDKLYQAKMLAAAFNVNNGWRGNGDHKINRNEREALRAEMSRLLGWQVSDQELDNSILQINSNWHEPFDPSNGGHGFDPIGGSASQSGGWDQPFDPMPSGDHHHGHGCWHRPRW